MTIHEFGKENKRTMVLIHPSVVMWDYFEYVIPLMETDYHLVIPAIPGYDPDENYDFTTIEEITNDLVGWLIQNDLTEIYCIYGCSMGGSIVIRSLLDKRLKIERVVIDGGITPYHLPWLITRFIAVKDYRYMKKYFPQTRFKLVRNAGHGGLAPFQPERLVKGLTGNKEKEGIQNFI